MLHGIGEEVYHYLFESRPIAHDQLGDIRSMTHGNRDLLLLGRDFQKGFHLVNQCPDVDLLPLDL